MQYLLTFIEGFISFISPCILPMLPIYISYFAGGESGNSKKTLKNSFAFVLGFSIIFILLGIFAGAIGGFLFNYKTILNVVCGIIVIFFGLCYLGVIKLKFFGGNTSFKPNNLGFFSSILFGIIFSVSFTPCVGAFLGSALTLAANEGSMFKGAILLVFYSLGLAVPFIVSALLIDKLKGTFSFIKKNYKVINTVCGIFLIIIGLLMAFGILGKFLALFL